MTNNVSFTMEEFERERVRRNREKSDQLQADFSPFVEDGLWKFCQHIAPEFYTDDKTPLYELCKIFQDVTLGKLRKVLISFFPRGGKSRTTSMWIAWGLGYDSEGSYMRNCYNDNIAMDLSKSVMDIIFTDAYKTVFPEVRLDPSARSKMNWQLDNTTITTYFGAGINGTITGKGCNRAAIFDDPIKNPEEALSESYLEKVDTFIDYALETRVEIGSDCAEIIISTRWSSKDPIGVRLGDPEWKTFIFPVLDKNDKSTCEAMFPTERAVKLRKNWKRKGRGWMFDALYMCEPTDAAFAKISLDSLKRFSMKDLQDKEPDAVIGWCDYANKGSDYLSSPIAYVYGDQVYVVGVTFSNDDSNELEQPLMNKIAYFKPGEFVFESQAGGIEFANRLQEKYAIILEAIGLEIETRAASTNKQIRIMLRLGEIKNNCHFLIDDEHDEHYRRFMSSLSDYGKFKFGKDDAPDSMAGLLSLLSDVADVNVSFIGNDNKILDNNYNDNEIEADDNTEIEIY